jgi:ferritin-like metal-binding protein YciE
MEDNNSNITSLKNLLDYNIQKATGAEAQLINILPEWINKSISVKLKIVLQKYLDLVQLHLEKLNNFLEEEKIISLGVTSQVMQAFIEETNEQLSKCTDAEVKDACLLAYLQNINHFKISLYGTSAAFANTLDMSKHASVFHEAEINEKQIDDRLSQLAVHEINVNARAPIILSE